MNEQTSGMYTFYSTSPLKNFAKCLQYSSSSFIHGILLGDFTSGTFSSLGFLLSGLLASSKEEGVEEFIAPCYIISPQGAKRIVYAIEDCVIVTVHANPTNTEDLDELAKINIVFDWNEYEEYLKSKK